ncbi:cbb3-type cytochrome c oxidase subunit I [Nitrococcus mobilis]|uniref:Cytochrome c oxidase, subunit I n=1 Tax=Nitrococcus mobilis Nb-231 TaxID=314278 RepID=A4BSP7_9GAMM|nr:cbb3-type cytochrome c oxidase subunit I [Nitrococcus mobilis]EAR21317.1 Cytochrome c oxidase, subunit I [Nitrococcus mobilis Nb-231]
MSVPTLYPEDERLTRGERVVFNLYIITALVVFVLMMLFGLVMRMAQGTWLSLPPTLFYQIMTAHGAGTVGTMGLASSAVMWFFLRKYVRLNLWAFLTNYVLFTLGALAILAAVFIGGYAGAWTFLYPLPVHSMGEWTVHAAVLFMLGYIAIGVGFLLFYLDAMAGVIRVYGNLGRALGLQWLFGGEIDPVHPKTVVASTMVIITNSIGTLAGAVVLVMSIINAYFPELALNALLAKNLIYLFGHTFINATIYMGVIAVYELLPRYSGRPYGISRPFLWAWAASTVMVLSVYPHHLLMDYVMPHWMLVMGQIVSYASGLPVFVVTAYGALTNVYRCGIRWRMPAKLMMLSMYGWAAGIVPAIIDATIRINEVMHNTQWVPGHFHFYLLLGVLPMILALMFHVIAGRAQSLADATTDKLSFPIYAVGGLAFAVALLAAGHVSAPRRYAVHLPQWVPYDQASSIAAILVIAAMLLFTGRIIAGLLRAPAHVDPAHPAG